MEWPRPTPFNPRRSLVNCEPMRDRQRAENLRLDDPQGRLCDKGAFARALLQGRFCKGAFARALLTDWALRSLGDNSRSCCKRQQIAFPRVRTSRFLTETRHSQDPR